MTNFDKNIYNSEGKIFHIRRDRVSQYSSLVDKSDKSACPALAPEIQSISDQIHQF